MESTATPYTRLPQMALHLRKGDSLKGTNFESFMFWLLQIFSELNGDELSPFRRINEMIIE